MKNTKYKSNTRSRSMARGKVRYADRIAAPEAREPQVLEGILSIAKSGNGFVSLTSGTSDVYIPQRFIGNALTGDRVTVRMLPPERGDTRRSGEITGILERSARDVVGTLQRRNRQWVAVPLDTSLPIFRIPDPKEAHEGDRIVLRFAAWEAEDPAPAGEVLDVIGPANDPSLDTLAILREYGFSRTFPDDVLAEAEHVSARLQVPGDRRDLRGDYILTIDPRTAKDFDDAISLTRDARGRRVLGVHIADVTHFVQPGSALDREARRRGTSVYLVDTVIPMLPEQLSNGVCSLRPDEDRLAFSVFLTFDEAGSLVERSFTKSLIRSRLRLTYEEAMAELSHLVCGQPPPEEPPARILPPEAQSLLKEAGLLARQVRERRFRNNALDLSVPEVRVDLGPDGRMTGLSTTPQDESHQLIEEFMVIANEAVATECAHRGISYLSRFHDLPDPEKLEELSVSLASLGISAGNLQVPRNLANLVQKVQKHPMRSIASMMILRSLKRAEYSADEHGHFGLGKAFYSHFTSPIRRYPDLMLHRQLEALLTSPKGHQPSLNELRLVARECSERERLAEQAERDLIEIKKYGYLDECLRQGNVPTFQASIIRVLEFGVIIEVADLGLSGMVHVSKLSNSFLRFHAGAQRLAGGGRSFSVGQTLRVFPAAVDVENRQVDFSPAP